MRRKAVEMSSGRMRRQVTLVKHLHVHRMLIKIQKSLEKDAESFKTSNKSQSNVSLAMFSLRRA